MNRLVIIDGPEGRLGLEMLLDQITVYMVLKGIQHPSFRLN